MQDLSKSIVCMLPFKSIWSSECNAHKPSVVRLLGGQLICLSQYPKMAGKLHFQRSYRSTC